ncbi:MAG TPA: Hsp20/alpha crystallin family protein [Blastocatellia bacterium]|nr:Hsp20/alpha crystallin family protein [Blastocatellia bacterium]
MAFGTAIAPARSLRGLTTIDPFRVFQARLNRLFEEPLGTLLPLEPFAEEKLLAAWTPACDVYETDKALIIKAELPEVKKENVFVSIEDNMLTIRGERKFEEETKRDNYHRVERSYGEFMRSFTLPQFVDSSKIIAEFKDGMLNLTLPKREEAKPKMIEVKVK